MKIIKKDGRLEEFNYDKIKTSITNSAMDSEQLVNESDLNIIVRDIVKNIEGLRGETSATSSYEVIGSIFTVLKRDGFENVIKAYLDYRK